MNGKITNANELTLKPQFTYWLVENSHLLFLAVLLLLLSNYLKGYEILRYIGSILSLFLLIIIFYKYISTLLCTKWKVTAEQIEIYKGVFAKSVNYIELYRVNDYQEKKSFLQTLMNNSNVYIYSGDKSNPVLEITGIAKGTEVIKLIRERVEMQKSIKRIYEFTNQ